MATDNKRPYGNPALMSLAACVVLVGAMFAWQLGVRGLNEPDEGRYASVAYEMLRSGDWWIPRFQGHIHLTKPPLTYWLLAASMKTFGVNEWAVRAVPALAGLGVVLLVWSLAWRWWGPRAALFSALILASSPFFFVMARVVDANMLLTFWVVLGLWSYLRFRDSGNRATRWIFYLAQAGALMTKGPVGSVLILLGMAAFRWADPRPSRSERLGSWPGLLIAIGLGLGWYLALVAQEPSRLRYFIVGELYDRVFTNAHRRAEPFWYFVWMTPLGFLPWLPLLAEHLRGTAARQPGPMRALAFWSLAVIVFFSLSRSKLPAYTLVVYPAWALIAGSLLDGRHGRSPSRAIRGTIVYVSVLALLVPAGLILAGRFRYRWEHLIHHSTLLAVALAAACIHAIVRERQRAWVVPAALLLFVSYAALLDTIRRHEGDLHGNSSIRPFARRALQAMQTPGPVYVTHAPAGLAFYLRRPDPLLPVPLASPGEVATAADCEERLRDLLPRLAGTGAHVFTRVHCLEAAGDPARYAGRVEARNETYALLRTDP
jgi:4-amino-4-deoxy-L-arabinose transferase-like glycosyltransferase